MKIVFLSMEFAPYQVTLYKQILKAASVEMMIFAVNSNCKNDFLLNDKIENYGINEFSINKLERKILDFFPDILVVSGWAYKKYNIVSKRIKNKLNIPILICSDTQWEGTFRQYINCTIGKYYLKSIYTHFWVAGINQYVYARKLGFSKEKILFNLYSCDVEAFNKVKIEDKRNNYPRKFIFVGRFVPVKGIEILVDAWNNIKDKNGWTLTLIGDGPLKESFQKQKDIIIKNYINNAELITEFEEYGCFVLPSIKEPWGVVIHEAAAAGLPIICTDVCGAAYHLVIDEFNGFKINSSNSEKLKKAIEKIIFMKEEKLMQFSYNSRKLAQNITPELGAANLMSLITKEINL